jgi:hypothetical protein
MQLVTSLTNACGPVLFRVVEANLLPTEYENVENAFGFSTCVPFSLRLLLLASFVASSVLKVNEMLSSKTKCSHGTRRWYDSERP